MLRALHLSAFAVLLLGAARPEPAAAPAQAAPRALAVIVNPKNPITNLTFNELRGYLRLDQQFWSSKERLELFLRPDDSPAMQILLDRVYRMTAEELDKHWVGKIFRGEIRAKPKVAPNARAALSRVLKVPGALSVVLAGESTEGARVLTIDGKSPGDPGYPLVEKAGQGQDASRDGSGTRAPDAHGVVEGRREEVGAVRRERH